MRNPIRPLAVLAVVAALFGCEHSDSKSDPGTHWNYTAPTTTTRPAATTKQTAATTTRTASAGKTRTAAPSEKSTNTATTTDQGQGASGDASGGTGSVPDAMSFNALRWVYGGKPRAGGARQNGVQITGLSVSKNGLSFRYVRDLSAWGYSSTALGGVACLFVRNAKGQWVGGKFDWISSSRQSRDFVNIYGGYDGWTLNGVPNPCPVAFVIVTPDGRRRSNVLVGTWSR